MEVTHTYEHRHPQTTHVCTNIHTYAHTCTHLRKEVKREFLLPVCEVSSELSYVLVATDRHKCVGCERQALNVNTLEPASENTLPAAAAQWAYL